MKIKPKSRFGRYSVKVKYLDRAGRKRTKTVKYPDQQEFWRKQREREITIVSVKRVRKRRKRK